MKFFVTSLFTFLSILSFGQTSWQEIAHIQGDYILQSIYFVDAQQGYVLGSTAHTDPFSRKGILAKSTDGGFTWDVDTFTQEPIRLYRMHFTDAQTGIITTQGADLYRTTNGGQSWDTIALGGIAANSGIAVIDSDTGYISNWGGEIFKTTDAGQQWNRVHFNGPAPHRPIVEISCPTAKTCYGAGHQAYWKSTDYGQNWTMHFADTLFARDVYCATEDRCVILNGNRMVQRTTNGGVNWQVTALPAVSPNTFDFEGNTGYIVGSQSLIMETTDEGANWTVVQIDTVSDTAQYFTDVFLLEADHGYILSTDGRVFGKGSFVGTAEVEKTSRFKVFPNPFEHQLQLTFDRAWQQQTIRFYNLMGELVQEEKIESGAELVLSTADWPNGWYTYRVSNGTETRIGKLLKE